MFVLSLIYSYVAVCRFCAARCDIVIYFFLSFANYSAYVFSIICMFVLCFLFCVFCVFVLFCVLFLLLYTAASSLYLHKPTEHCHQAETQPQ